MPSKVAVLKFPGTNNDLDAIYALRDLVRLPSDLVWHTDFKESSYAAAVIPGGFSYGDHLRAGIIAAHSPAMKEIRRMGQRGKPVIGICNGFQILTESGLLPGALLRNEQMSFVCKWVRLKVMTSRSVFTSRYIKGDVFPVPTNHGEGRYVVDEETLTRMYENDQVLFKYVDSNGRETPEANPNGSMQNIAGVCNEKGNVVGMMPHPERASEKLLSPFHSDNAKLIFESLRDALRGDAAYEPVKRRA